MFCVLNFKGVNVIVVVRGGSWGTRSKLGYGNLSVGAEAGVFENLGDLCADCCVEEGDAATNLAAEWVVEGVVVWALGAVE